MKTGLHKTAKVSPKTIPKSFTEMNGLKKNQTEKI